jgi:hypothetical protein
VLFHIVDFLRLEGVVEEDGVPQAEHILLLEEHLPEVKL